MSDEAALLRAVRAHPIDSTPKLVLADYYDENGLSSHARVWRHFGGYDADNVRVKAYTASKKAFDHSDRLTGGTSTLHEPTGDPTRDPEAAARIHMFMARHHNTAAEDHEFQFTSATVPDHLNAAKAHTEAAHALSPGLRAHAATFQTEDTPMTSAAYRHANRATGTGAARGRVPDDDTKAEQHTIAADVHEELARRVVSSDSLEQHRRAGQHLHAARLHREAAAHYARETT